MPPELKKALNANASAKKNWPTYTESQRKMFLYMVNGAKRPRRAPSASRVCIEIVVEEDAVRSGRRRVHEEQTDRRRAPNPRLRRSRTRPSTFSTTSLIGIVVVSMCTASGASVSGDTVRVVSDVSRAWIAAATAACPT